MTSGENEAAQKRGVEDVAANAAKEMLGLNPFVGLYSSDIVGALSEIGEQALKVPLATLTHEARFARALFSIMAGTADVIPAKGDKRFLDPAWTENPFYHRYLQGYLAWSNALGDLIDSTGLDSVAKQRARFAMSLLADTVAPTNTLLGNPAALKKAIESGGKSLLEGSKNLLADVATHHGMPTMVDVKAFQPGRNLALSPGAVVWRNDVLELIQYAPATDQVYARPQLIVPPQINKFYILDLAPGRSIVEYLVKGGLQVFTVSWRNPTPEQRAWDMDTYVSALLEAIAAVRDITGADDVNITAACVGGMTVAALLGYLAAKREKLVNAATLTVTVVDTDTDSLLGLFVTPEIIAAAKLNSRLKGVLEGDEMGRIFAWMRPNDLVWNYWVNNYLMGNPPPAFDILYWNGDTTRLPAAFHAQIMDIYAGALLQQQGAVSILGTPIDLSRIACDKFVVAGVTDHITPWKSVYRMARIFSGNTEFVLASSGHVQTLINPPGNPKAKFFLNRQLPATPENWLEAAQEVSGTWWDHWREWLAARSGEMRPAPVALGNERHRPGVKAPGTYVVEP